MAGRGSKKKIRQEVKEKKKKAGQCQQESREEMDSEFNK